MHRLRSFRQYHRKSIAAVTVMASFRPIDALLFEHPRSVGESYSEHFGIAFMFGLRMLVGGLAALVHALLPCLFKTSASQIVRQLYTQLQTRTPRN